MEYNTGCVNYFPILSDGLGGDGRVVGCRNQYCGIVGDNVSCGSCCNTGGGMCRTSSAGMVIAKKVKPPVIGERFKWDKTDLVGLGADDWMKLVLHDVNWIDFVPHGLLKDWQWWVILGKWPNMYGVFCEYGFDLTDSVKRIDVIGWHIGRAIVSAPELIREYDLGWVYRGLPDIIREWVDGNVDVVYG